MTTKKASKPKLAADEKLERQDFDMFKAIDAIDAKDYSYFQSLTEEQQRKFSSFMMIQWVSSIKARGVLPAYYVMSVDANANKHLFNERVQAHPELQWLMLCAASPGMGKQFHQWIPNLKDRIEKIAATNKPQTPMSKKEVAAYFERVYPGESAESINTVSEYYVADRDHKVRLAKLFPAMKVEDVEMLSKIVTSKDLEEYEKESGN
jgi:hypothetical protein